jgi:alkylhydroperoxidase/carboxymuconolactone decarboxylase family protein YurZ
MRIALPPDRHRKCKASAQATDPDERQKRRRAVDKDSIATPGVSRAFQAFLTEAPAQANAWMQAVEALSGVSALDQKTAALAYLAVLAALRLESGVPFHVDLAKRAGATRPEVVSAILVGLPAAGNAVTQCLPAALAAYDAR